MLLCLVAAKALAEPRFRVIDRRATDGSVIVVRHVPRRATGGKPFLSAGHWDLTPSSDFFRVREVRIPARHAGTRSDPPAITMRDGKVAPNNWTNAFGGSPSTFFEPGEIVRLVRLNAAFKIVRMDVESVCRQEARGRRLRGRVDVVLSGQVNAATFEEANKGVAQVLEPVELARVLEVCDPETGEPPLRITVGMPAKAVQQRLGEPEGDQGSILDYRDVKLEVRNGSIVSISVPVID
jgi:hypothetical protein